ncbi:MAG: DUF5085 family protein [Ruminococcus sp.]|nr:DUF5085 family protein [Ruminococcus sp.]
MQIIERQSIFLFNVIKYKINVEKIRFPAFIEHIERSISALGVKLTERVVFRFADHGDNADYELFIPVDKELQSREEYGFDAVFRLLQAVTVRHEGNFLDLGKTEKRLVEYIKKKNYTIISEPYYRVIRIPASNCFTDCIVDIYIGVKYNAS